MASAGPALLRLDLEPATRVDLIDVTAALRAEFGDVLKAYRKALYCSHHTTAGYFEQPFANRLGNRREHLDRLLSAFGRVFPPGAEYLHDKIELRTELSDEQKKTEPLNADSHLTFIGSGLRNCVTYVNRPEEPVYFVDLDGVSVNGEIARRRRTTVLAFDREEPLAEIALDVPLSGHRINAVNLRDPRLGLFERLDEAVRRSGVERGRVDLALAPDEPAAGLTVNEYETLLMRHDLAEVLKDPLRYVAATGRKALANPRAIPGRALQYARYDFVRLFNELLDAVGARESLLEKILARFLAVPANRFLRLKRSVSLLVAPGPDGRPGIVQGTYQSPILVQWRKAEGGRRRMVATVSRFE